MFHEISWWDLEFDRTPVNFLSAAGVLQTKWVRVGMPRIPSRFLDCVFFCYATHDDAKAGRNPGGTGFIVTAGGPFTFGQLKSGLVPYYAISNWHVVCRDGYSVIRLNRHDGGIDIFEFGPEDWEFLPGKMDVAALPLKLDGKIHKFSTVGTYEFAPNIEVYPGAITADIGVGEDVFMIGLFLDHDGVTTNVPSARFGNISMLPNPHALIPQPTGYEGVSYVVDMHSRTGFSGSPVFVYRTFATNLTEANFPVAVETQRGTTDRFGKGGFVGKLNYQPVLKLLGIHWAQFPERWELKDKKRLQETSRATHLITEGKYVEGMSGMTCVIPAWQIAEVLNMPKFVEQRVKISTDAAMNARNVPKPESVPPANDENPNAREDFNRLLGAAARKRQSSD